MIGYATSSPRDVAENRKQHFLRLINPPTSQQRLRYGALHLLTIKSIFVLWVMIGYATSSPS